METSVDRAEMSYSHTNPLFEMSLSRNDLYSFQTEDLSKSKRPTRQWCMNLIIGYLILLTGVNIFLIYKVFTLESWHSNPRAEKLSSSNEIPLEGDRGDADLPKLIRNNSQETKSLRGDLGALQSKMNSICGPEGQLGQLRSDLSRVNTSTYSLEGRLAAISLMPGATGMKGDTGHPGPPGAAGVPGPAGAPGQKGDSGTGVGVTGPQGPKGEQGPTGPQGPSGPPGPSGSSGPAGPQGPAGSAGSDGAPGQVGPPGGPGSPGLKGDPGDSGVQGPPGIAGAAGEKGDTGLTGPPGVPGTNGDTGMAGLPATAGPSGTSDPSLAGPRGLPGMPGPPGPRGPSGEKGEKGSPGERPVKVRLIGTLRTRGRVEVMHEGVWGTVCDDNFDTVDGTVICRMLGYRTATSTYTSATPGTGRILLDDLQCTGRETDIFDCLHNGVGINNCSHGEDAGVQCA